MISIVKDIFNPVNWFKLARNPKKIKKVYDRIFYYPGLNFARIKPIFLRNFYKTFVIKFLNKVAKKNKNLEYFFFHKEKIEIDKINSELFTYDLKGLSVVNLEDNIYESLRKYGIVIIENALSSNQHSEIIKIFHEMKSQELNNSNKKIEVVGPNMKSKDVKVSFWNTNLDSFEELINLSNLVTKKVFGLKIPTNAFFMTHESIRIPEEIFHGDNILHVDRFLPNLKLIYFPFEVDNETAPFTYALGSHVVNNNYLNFFMNNKDNIFDETNEKSKIFLNNKIKVIAKKNTLVLTLTNGFHGRIPFAKNKERSAVFLTYPDFNLFSLLIYKFINFKNK